ncbi:putative 115 kDa protein in type-1 retrotransposable element R1DM [Purpureocillium lavendulum]|uniref:115 kDa protein in type-1 retrotransposable element R1DM n=1 Tax=Purpureocillium lavendulum TaxID=1247861 RepID=A0AB34FGZ0_9HYPO|nr:putative 115 kDa protein in type-1 retrotransposable element R1DM [Purpureocillium lavendulum]
MPQTPVVPPRPSRADKDGAAGMPKVPPRPVNKRIDRSISPNPDRFAPSPLHGGIAPRDPKAAALSAHYAHKEHAEDPIERSGSVPMPSVGEEGVEYSAVASELEHERATSPEQTRTIAEDLKLHAPKPSLPAVSAKQQVMAVTRTDSDKAASFGIGRPTSDAGERTASRNSFGQRKRPSSTLSTYSDHQTEDEQGIPEIGQRVPMNPHLGDVQAPSPGPGAESNGSKKHHSRKHSANRHPPGSYGLYGHGMTAQDKLDKAYYQKHPEALEREKHTPLHDRQNDYAMSSSDLNRLVRDTVNRQAALGIADMRGTPTDEVAFQASEEYATRISSRPTSMVAKDANDKAKSGAEATGDKPIHVDDARHPEFYQYGDEDNAEGGEEDEYTAPILAEDEVKKEKERNHHHPAVRPHLERRRSSQSYEEAPSRPTSRPSSIRVTISQPDYNTTALEDVEEYEPLFDDEGKEIKQADKPKHEPADENEGRHHFPSKDIWEDAPSSVHYTATVSTPEVPDQNRRRSSAYHEDRPITPAQAFAQYQEQLAEKEASGRVNNFLPLSEDKPTWIGNQPHLKAERERPSSRRFPSRDVWEDAPESLCYEATISGSPTEDKKPEIPARPAKKPSPSEPPSVPVRPQARQGSGDDSVKARPPVSDKPKPQIPPRPAKSSSGDSKDGTFSKPKPPVPSRPTGSKIAALQAGFMSDLNKRLQLGPQAHKKEEAAKEEEVVEEKEKAPLSDARKGRARGPQRRAPAKSPAAAAPAAAPALSFSQPQISWSIDPEDGDVSVGGEETEATPEAPKVEPLVSSPEKTAPEEPPETTTLVEEPPAVSVPESKNEEEELPPPATKLPEQTSKHVEPAAESPESSAPVKEETLAANMAGESVLEAVVKEEDGGNEIEPVEVHDDVK